MAAMREIERVYDNYYPDNTGLTISVSKETSYAFNKHWPGGEDEKRPIDLAYFKDGTVKTCGKYIRQKEESNNE